MAVDKVYQKFKKYIFKYKLILPHDRIVLALSGGCDSVVLFHLLQRLQQELSFDFVVCHLDHGIRGKISAAESCFVQDLCERNEVECFCGFRDIPYLAQGRNLEEVARQQRYDFLREIAQKIAADKIATAHHADDQAETVLLHLLRGCGGEGLAAIVPMENDLIRPLLFAQKQSLVEYSEQYGLSFCEDASNFDQSYLRNKIRLSLLPYLEQNYNTNIKESLCALAEICRAEQAFLEQQAVEHYASICKDGGLDKKMLSALPLGLQRQVVRKAYREVCGEELSFKLTEAVLALGESSSLDLPKVTVFCRSGVLFFGQLAKVDDYDYFVEVVLNDWQNLPGGWEYLVVSQPQQVLGADCFEVVLAEGAKLFWSGRRLGDKLTLKGGHKSVKSIYQESKIALEERQMRPILYMNNQPVWLPFLRKAVLQTQVGKRLVIYCRRKIKFEQ